MKSFRTEMPIVFRCPLPTDSARKVCAEERICGHIITHQMGAWNYKYRIFSINIKLATNCEIQYLSYINDSFRLANDCAKIYFN